MSPARLNAARSLLGRARARLLDEVTPAKAWTALQALGIGLRLRPSLNHHWQAPSASAPSRGSRLQFLTRDGSIELHLVLGDGKVEVGRGRIDRPDVTVWFRKPADMRTFFTEPDALFDMLLSNQVSFDGNLSVLARLGHISNAVRLGSQPEWHVELIPRSLGARDGRLDGELGPMGAWD